MGIAENKQVIRDYFDALAKSDYPTALGFFADDITWWVLPSSPLAGNYVGKDAVLELFGKGTGLYDASVPLQPQVTGIVRHGDGDHPGLLNQPGQGDLVRGGIVGRGDLGQSGVDPQPPFFHRRIGGDQDVVGLAIGHHGIFDIRSIH